MQAISIKNFKSYDNLLVTSFNPHLNIIIGGNGQGKSNLFKALSFALSDRLSLNRTEFNSCLHRGIGAAEESSIQVEVLMKVSQHGEESEDILKLSKVWTAEPKEELYINSNPTNRKQYENFVQSLRLSYSSPYNIVQQGKISQITLMDEFELYRLLEEIAGVRKFYKRKEQALSTMKKVHRQKQEIEGSLLELDQRMKSLEVQKEEFEYFEVEQKTKKYRMKKQLEQFLESTQLNLEKIRQEYSAILQTLTKLQNHRQKMSEQVTENNIYINCVKENLLSIEHQSFMDTKTQSTEAMGTQQHKHIIKQLQSTDQQLKKCGKLLQLKDNQIAQFKTKFAQIQKKFEQTKLRKNVPKNKLNMNKFIKQCEDDLNTDRQKIKQLTQYKHTITQQLKKLLQQTQKQHSDRFESEIKECVIQKQKLNQQMLSNKSALFDLRNNKSILTIQINSERQIHNVLCTKLRKVLPMLDFSLMKAIRDNRVEGVYGYFIELVKLDKNMAFAYEAAGMNRLCSLLVEDENACNQVINLNRRVKGRQINIIQMSYIRRQAIEHRSFPKSSAVQKITNSKWIKPSLSELQGFPDSLKGDIEKLIQNTFGKYAIVSDYTTGLTVSKEYNLNCITANREVIYAQGYLCKLGKAQKYKQSRLQAYEKFDERAKKLRSACKSSQSIQTDIEHHEQLQISLINQISKLDSHLKKNSNRMQQLLSIRKVQQSQQKDINTIESTIQSLEKGVRNKQQCITKLTNSKTKDSLLSAAEINKIEGQYANQRKALNQMLRTAFEYEQSLQNLHERKQQLQKQLQNEPSVTNTSPAPSNLNKQIQLREMQNKDKEKQIEELNHSESEIERERNHLQIKMNTYQQQEIDLRNKLSDLTDITLNEEEIEELSNSVSLSRMSMHNRKPHHFSVKDKLLFHQFSAMFAAFNDNKKVYSDLLQAEEKIYSLIADYEKDADVCMQKLSQRFEEEFRQIFSKLVDHGEAQVRFKKISQKYKQSIRYKNCMIIKVAFSHEGLPTAGMRKWNEFSGGEKTLIAIAILITLQRCEPAPIYILDEFDSALDSMHVHKIAALLAEESVSHNVQYFITSFKNDMLSFSQDICNYYMVQNENRKSKLLKVDGRTARDVMSAIVSDR